jgi:post-segregation antitoxin (ccd killing protein)
MHRRRARIRCGWLGEACGCCVFLGLELAGSNDGQTLKRIRIRFASIALAAHAARPQWTSRPPRVYTMRMSRVNVYLPDDLADEARRAGLNISSLTQDAIRSSLARQDLALWQQRVAELDSANVSHSKVIEAVNSAKDEFEGA